jgi:hypothetical protein
VLDLDQSRRARAAIVAREAREANRERAVTRFYDDPEPWGLMLLFGAMLGLGILAAIGRD